MNNRQETISTDVALELYRNRDDYINRNGVEGLKALYREVAPKLKGKIEGKKVRKAAIGRMAKRTKKSEIEVGAIICEIMEPIYIKDES